MLSDMETSDVLAPSGLEGLSPSSSFEKLDLAKLDLNSLAADMKKRCEKCFLENYLDIAIREPRSWPWAISLTLMQLTSALATTNIQSSVIPPPSIDDAQSIVAGFTEEELEDWRNGVKSGLKDGDWVPLIRHRMYISDCWTIGLFNRKHRDAPQPKSAKCSLGRADRILYGSLLPISFCLICSYPPYHLFG